MMDLIDYCKDHTIDQILELPDIKERVELYASHKELFKSQLERCATIHDNLVVLDLRHEDTIYTGSRFAIYALFPQCNISIHTLWGFQKQNTVFAVGKSIFDRSCKTNIGDLMLKHGGGGHQAAGTCQVSNQDADSVLAELISKINNNEVADKAA